MPLTPLYSWDIGFIDEPADPPSPYPYPNSSDNLKRPCPCGPVRSERAPWPYHDANTGFAPSPRIFRQTFRQRDNWSPQEYGTRWPSAYDAFFGAVAYLIEETPLRDVGGNIKEWDRVWAERPLSFDVPAIVTKTFYYVSYLWDGPGPDAHVVDAMVTSFTRSLKGRIRHDFYSDKSQVPQIPKTPYVAVVRFGNFGGITDLGTGFPTGPDPGNHNPYPIFTNNEAECCVGATIENYLGRMVVLKTSYAAA